MPVNILTNRQGQSIGLIQLDAVVSNNLKATIDVTDHEVERGANIADHARPKPRLLTLQCVITNTPNPGQQANRVVRLVGVNFRSNVPEENATQNSGYTRAAYDELERLRIAGELVTVITDLDKFANMMITDISIPRDRQTGDALVFTVEFKEVRLVSNLITEEKVTKTDRSKGTKKKDPPQSEAKEKDIVQSWAVQLNDAGGDPMKTKEFARKPR